MKRVLLALIIIGMSLGARGQDKVTFECTDGIPVLDLKQIIEQQVINLLTQINTAESRGMEVNFADVDISETAKKNIVMMWENAPFRTVDNEIIERCLPIKTYGRVTGYLLRNISVQMKPVKHGNYFDKLIQDICIYFDHHGKIKDFCIAINSYQFNHLIKESEELDDIDRRIQLIRFCEQLRTAYATRDIEFFKSVFNKFVVDTRHTRQHVLEPKTNNVYGDSTFFFNNLTNLFNRAGNSGGLKTDFNDISIVMHRAKPRYYGLTIMQSLSYRTDKKRIYQEDLVFFFIWDFTNEEQPMIHVKTIQSQDKYNERPFKLEMFRLP